MEKYRSKKIIFSGRRKGSRPPEEYCYCCGKSMRGKTLRMIHVINGGMAALHPEDEALYESDAGDMLWFAIGPSCARQLGLDWTYKLSVSAETQESPDKL